MITVLRFVAALPFLGLAFAFGQIARLMLAIAKPIVPPTPLPAWLHQLDGELAEEGVD